MRELINIVEGVQRNYEYVGNCTNVHAAPYLEDMMDAAVSVSYRTLCAAIGRDQLKHHFPDFDWSHRPRALTMQNDYAVSYYRSIYDGKPCFFVRESGVEFIFADVNYEDPSKTSFLATAAISPDGDMTSISSTSRSVFSVRKKGPVGYVSQITATTTASIAALKKWVIDSGIDTIIEDDYDDDPIPVQQFISNLR